MYCVCCSICSTSYPGISEELLCSEFLEEGSYFSTTTLGKFMLLYYLYLMGRKRRDKSYLKPFCYYCERVF
jgi:hypothetical protein